MGNGPSAIALSYLLHGHRPYYNGNPHSDSLLVSRLHGSKASIVDQDLEFLSEGLEGRSPNPVALLWDALTHPDADLGAESSSLLKWKYEPDKAIPHLVLGKMKPGGSWQRMEGNMQTLSQSTWMEMPDRPFRQWLADRGRKQDYRATVGDVCDYYEEYVTSAGLKEHFMDYHVVTSVQKVFHMQNGADCESGEVEPCCQNIQQNHRFLWEVRGYRIVNSTSDEDRSDFASSSSSVSHKEGSDINNGEMESSSEGGSCSRSSSCSDLTGNFEDLFLSGDREEFCYLAANVILATGTYDIPNRLGVPGETSSSVIHSLCAFEKRLSVGDMAENAEPVCVVGAGLSAADAILMAMEAGVPVIHVFRCGPQDPNLIFRRLPQSMYPEYHRVAQLMRGEVQHELYTPYPRHRIVEINHQMVLLKPSTPSPRTPSPPATDNSIISLEVACTVIMIGSRPDLSFLPGEGRNLGLVPKWPIDNKHNPIDVDQFSYQSSHEHGLFAMGPLIGDNFVRFGIGGALGITSHLTQKSQK